MIICSENAITVNQPLTTQIGMGSIFRSSNFDQIFGKKDNNQQLNLDEKDKYTRYGTECTSFSHFSSTPISGQKSKNTRMAVKLVSCFVKLVYLHRTLTRMSRTSG